MKQKKQWVVVAGMGIASVLICAILVLSNAFTGQASAAGGDVDATVATPELFLSGPPHSLTKITADTPDPSTPGQAVTVSVTVSGTGPVPSGEVDVISSDASCTIFLTNGSGSCGLVFFTKGSKTIKAFYLGDGTYNPSSAKASHKVVKAKTATSITGDTPDPSVIGQIVVVDVTVYTTGVLAPTGLVTVTGANTKCSGYLSGGTMSCSVILTSTGFKTFKAVYAGDANNAGSSGSASHFVDRTSSTTIITSETPDPSIPGQAVKVKVRVDGAAVGPKPTGQVRISGADGDCIITLSSGVGSCSVVFQTIGDRTLTATYYGDKNFFGSSTSAAHSVKNATTTAITGDNPDSSLPGEAVQVDVTVSGPGTAPTGTVDITGADVNCTVTLAGGSGSCSVQFNSAGARLLQASYNGDANYVGSANSATHTVRLGNSVTTIIGDTPDPSAPYAAILVTVSVAPAAPGVLTPSGSVAISSIGYPSVCTATLVNGTGSCSVTFISAGTVTLTATYSGDNTYHGSWVTDLHTIQ
jgi:hypothetical protein